MALPNLPQMDKFAILMNEETGSLVVRTWWVPANGETGLGSMQDNEATQEEWQDEDHDIVGIIKSHYDAAKADFADQGGTLGSESPGERYGFISET